MSILSDNDAIPSPNFFETMYKLSGLKRPLGLLRYADPMPITLSRTQALILYDYLCDQVDEMDPEREEASLHAMSALLDDLKVLLEAG